MNDPRIAPVEDNLVTFYTDALSSPVLEVADLDGARGYYTDIPFPLCNVVFDARSGGRLPAISLPGGTPEEHLAAGTWARAESLSALAELIGVPAESLTTSVERFNALAAAGEDTDFGRGRDEYDRYFADPVLVPVTEPPFTAARLVLSDLGTKGGLVTDVDARVLDVAGRPLPGLYAIGNASASLTGRVYPGPGAPIGTSSVCPPTEARSRLPSPPLTKSSRRNSDFGSAPKLWIWATPAVLAAFSRKANCSLSRLSTAWPPGTTPSKISAFAAAISSRSRKLPRWAGAIVVIIATCGRTIPTSGRISLAWFMPISKMP